MLDAFIIEELRRREEAERRKEERDRPRLEMPVYNPSNYSRTEPSRDEDEEKPSDRGVIIIEY